MCRVPGRPRGPRGAGPGGGTGGGRSPDRRPERPCRVHLPPRRRQPPHHGRPAGGRLRTGHEHRTHVPDPIRVPALWVFTGCSRSRWNGPKMARPTS